MTVPQEECSDDAGPVTVDKKQHWCFPRPRCVALFCTGLELRSDAWVHSYHGGMWRGDPKAATDSVERKQGWGGLERKQNHLPVLTFNPQITRLPASLGRQAYVQRDWPSGPHSAHPSGGDCATTVRGRWDGAAASKPLGAHISSPLGSWETRPQLAPVDGQVPQGEAGRPWAGATT